MKKTSGKTLSPKVRELKKNRKGKQKTQKSNYVGRFK